MESGAAPENVGDEVIGVQEQLAGGHRLRLGVPACRPWSTCSRARGLPAGSADSPYTFEKAQPFKDYLEKNPPAPKEAEA